MKSEDILLVAKEFFSYYKNEVGKAARTGKKVISFSFYDLASFSHELAEQLLKAPEDVLRILELALDEAGLISGARVRLSELPESQHIKIRDIRAKHLSQFITIEGIVRQASDVRPQVVNAKFECPSCGTLISVLQVDKRFREPSRCSCGRKGNFRLVSKDMVDAQRLVIEESPESLVGGEQPRRINVFLQEDLVEPHMEEKTTPGSRVKVIGILKEVPVPLQTGAISVRFDLAIEANNIIPLEETFEEIEINPEDERQIYELAADPKIFERLAASIAPSIYGYEEIKQAIVLQLLGGVRKKRSDGTFFRGDIHILLVGDPGVAKSVLLKFVAGISPKGRYVAGRGATGAGITATVVRDEFLKGWSLEAGAMVLCNKGVLCVDEIEKMSEEDRSSMHEAMEQQTVTISKANIQATLRAETAVLAAANPKLGRFDPFNPIAQQINMPPTLINRFDVIFTIRDMPEKTRDEAIATHVLLEQRNITSRNVIEPTLLKKYFAYARQRIHPELTDKAVEEIKKFYVELRNKPVYSDDLLKPIPISARQLEALVRLSAASARSRLSKKITKEDALRAIELLKHSLMQVGFDYETKTIDIDRIATGVPTSQRSRILVVREALVRLESRLGKLIPEEELYKELEGKLEHEEIKEALDELNKVGDIFVPRRGFVQRI